MALAEMRLLQPVNIGPPLDGASRAAPSQTVMEIARMNCQSGGLFCRNSLDIRQKTC
jgi:hypothetical protein